MDPEVPPTTVLVSLTVAFVESPVSSFEIDADRFTPTSASTAVFTCFANFLTFAGPAWSN